MDLRTWTAACAATLVLAALAAGPVGAQSPPARGAEPRFDVAVTDAPARAFFEGLVDGTPYNVVLEPGVTGTVSLKLRNVTVPEVLAAVREAYGYDFREIPGGYVVEAATVTTRLYQVDYLDLERRGTSRTRVTSGQVTQSGNRYGSNRMGQGTSMAGEPEGTSGAGGGAGTAGERGDLTGSSIATRSSSDFWHDLETSLRALLPGEGRSVVVNPQSGVIAVRALPAEQREVRDYLAKVQSVVTRQVVLEAKILEVELSNGFQAGVNWAVVGTDGGKNFFGGQTGPQQGWTGNLLNQPSQPVTVGPGHPVSSLLTNTLGGAFTLAVDAADFNVFIEALKTQGETRVLSSPRVSTLNNQKAVIKAGSDEFFVTGVSSNTVVGTSSATNRDVELTPFFSGIALDVTPQIAADGAVILHIHPTVSDVTEKVKSLTVAGTTDQLPLAFSQVRESDSVVKARSGQVIVIGGLMRSQRIKQDFRTPFLGDVPVLGNLFKSQRQTDVKTELVILLRPVVVDDDAQWAGLVKAPVDRAIALDPKAGAGVP
jgi:MSHA biogenesis protein MshL